MTNERDTPARATHHDTAAAEIAALERAVSGARDAFGARAVLGGLTDAEGTLRFRASAPVGTGLPAPWHAGSVPGLEEAFATGAVTRLAPSVVSALPGPAGEDGAAAGEALLVPLVSRGEALGALVLAFAPGVPVPEPAVLALLGGQIGLALEALRDCGTLTLEAAGLADCAALLDRVLDVVPDAIKVLDLDGRVLYWNPASERLYGWSAAEVEGERMPHVPEDMRLRAVQDIRRIAASGRPVEREAIASRKDTTPLALRLAVAPFHDRDGHPAGVVSVATALAEECSVASHGDEFIGAVAHSLKAPLTAIVGFAQLLSRPEILEDAGRRNRTLKALEERGARMATLVDDLLLATRLAEEGLELAIEPTDLAGVVTEVVSRFEKAARHARFVIDYDASMGPVPLDRRRIDQALSSLVENAVRFAPPGSEIHVAVRLEGAQAVVEVTDLGPGLAEDERERVFDRYYRGQAGTNPDAPGLGLGLYLARMIAEAHGGSATVGGEAGRESTFGLRIPAG